MGRRRSAYSSVSNGICRNTAERNRIELEGIVRRRDAVCQFRDALTSLKDRLASKSAARTGTAAPAEVYYRAS
jgi:hypothetical protein